MPLADAQPRRRIGLTKIWARFALGLRGPRVDILQHRWLCREY